MYYNIRSLQVFECVYRHASLAGAARELGITSSAVSHQLRSLREQIGEELFVKQGRNIAFTDRGRQIAESLKYAFSEIDSSVRDGIAASSRFLRVTMCSCFGLGWFIPHLNAMGQAKWRNHLRVKMYAEDTDLSDRIADVFFSTTPLKSGYWSAKLFDETLIAVAKQADAGQQLITHDVDEATFGDDWQAFARTAGDLWPSAFERSALVGASHYVFGLEMAMAGVGVALVPDFLAERSLKEGSVVLASRHRMPSGRAYYINIKHARRHEPLIDAFCAWIVKIAARRARRAMAAPAESPPADPGGVAGGVLSVDEENSTS
ncbi:UNVERIFIED_ORG: LysR family transcriptional regulator (plasmid) [Roseateles sp. XES5]|nr:LysR family transcriptional regulator [Roseateles sp. XES5]